MARERQFGKAAVEVSIRDRVGSGLKAIERKMKSFGAGVAALGGAVAGVGAAAGGTLLAAAKSFASAGDDIEKMAARTGLTAEALSGLAFAAGQSGTSINALERSLRRMQATVTDAADGTQTSVDALGALGLAVDDLAGKSPENQFETIAQAISEIEDPTVRAARAMDIFGRSGTDLLPMFAGGAQGIAELRAEASKLGHTLTTEDAAAAAELTDAFGRVSATFKGLVTQLGAAVAPMITKVLNGFSELASGVVAFVKTHRGLVTALAIGSAAATVFGFTLVALGGAFVGLGMVVSGVSALIGVLASPLVPIIALVAALVGLNVLMAAGFGYLVVKSGALDGALSLLGEALGQLKQIVEFTFGGIMDALSAGEYVLAAKILWAGLKMTFFTGASWVLKAFDWLWDNAWKATAKFFSFLADKTFEVFKKIPLLIKAALTGGQSIAEVMAETLAGDFEIGNIIDDKIKQSQAELAALRAEADAANKAKGKDAAGGAADATGETQGPLSLQKMLEGIAPGPEQLQQAMAAAGLNGLQLPAAPVAGQPATIHAPEFTTLADQIAQWKTGLTDADMGKDLRKSIDLAKRERERPAQPPTARPLEPKLGAIGTSSAAAVVAGAFGFNSRPMEDTARNTQQMARDIRQMKRFGGGGFR